MKGELPSTLTRYCLSFLLSAELVLIGGACEETHAREMQNQASRSTSIVQGGHSEVAQECKNSIGAFDNECFRSGWCLDAAKLEPHLACEEQVKWNFRFTLTSSTLLPTPPRASSSLNLSPTRHVHTNNDEPTPDQRQHTRRSGK